MFERFVELFIKRHFLTKLFLLLYLLVFFLWHKLKNEEQSNVTYDSIRVSVDY